MRDDFKYFVLTGEALEVLKVYDRELKAINDRREARCKAFEADLMATMEADNKRMQKLWVKMAASVGLDSDISWGNPEYGIDSRYLAENFGALTYSPMPPMVQQMFGQPGVGPEMAPDKPPKGTKLN